MWERRKMVDIDPKEVGIKTKIEGDFSVVEPERLFDDFLNDKEAMSFIPYYNKTVLDHSLIDFLKFKKKWMIQGMTGEFCSAFDKHQTDFFKEIREEKDIVGFYKNHCIYTYRDKKGKERTRSECSFCSKLFHTVLPAEFPPFDKHIRNNFDLEDGIKSVLTLKGGYELFIKHDGRRVKGLREFLSQDKFRVFRVPELSDMRLIDMYYWYQGWKSKQPSKKTKIKRILKKIKEF